VAGQDVPQNDATGGARKVTYIQQKSREQRLWDAAYELEEAHIYLDGFCFRDDQGIPLSLAQRIALALGEPDA
jgi:hypothetical protein